MLTVKTNVFLATGVGLIAVTALNTAHAVGVLHEKNFGQCKKEHNRNACENNKDKFKGCD